MKEIKFKAWATKGEYFKPLEDDGDYYFRDDGDGLKLHDKFGECKDVVLLQFTGLKDKNGKEMYEGDIIKCGYGTGKVVEMLGCFMVQWVDDKEAEMEFLGLNKKARRQREDDEQFEVIGNIYETPQLIQQ